ncbi:MAG: transporter [Clostridia bacterium]|nr:transporter [Clostridia bacterium]
MENLILSFNVVLPLFLIMLLGYGLKNIELVDDKSLKVMNNLVFRIFLPLMLFKNVYKTDLKSVFNLKLTVFTLTGLLALYIVLFILIPIIEKENKKRGVLIQAIFRSNFIIFGIPITISILGENQAGVTSLLIAFVIPLYNLLSVIALETFRGGKLNLKKTLKGIVTNPLIIASLIGLLFIITDIKLPLVIEDTISDISGIATPLALIVLGGSFTFTAIKGNLKQILIGVIGKLFIVPLIFIPLSIYMGFRGTDLVTLMVLFAAPTAVSSFTMAQQMGADSDLACQLVVFDSTLSILTIFLWVFSLMQLGFI